MPQVVFFGILFIYLFGRIEVGSGTHTLSTLGICYCCSFCIFLIKAHLCIVSYSFMSNCLLVVLVEAWLIMVYDTYSSSVVRTIFHRSALSSLPETLNLQLFLCTCEELCFPLPVKVDLEV